MPMRATKAHAETALRARLRKVQAQANDTRANANVRAVAKAKAEDLAAKLRAAPGQQRTA